MSVALRAHVAAADVTELFEHEAQRLQAVVSRKVRTSAANVEDACGFAWLQLVRHRPCRQAAFAWLCTTAIREAVKLDRRTAQSADLDEAVRAAGEPCPAVDARLELIAAGQAIRQARLRPREAAFVGLRVAGYSRRQMAGLTGDSDRTVDRQLARAQRKLRVARRAQTRVR